MLRHIVLWKFKESAEGQTKEQNIDMMSARLWELPEIINLIKGFEVGKDVCHTEKSYDMNLISDFESVEKMKEYRDHPDHVAVSQLMAKLVESRVVIDYEY